MPMHPEIEEGLRREGINSVLDKQKQQAQTADAARRLAIESADRGRVEGEIAGRELGREEGVNMSMQTPLGGQQQPDIEAQGVELAQAIVDGQADPAKVEAAAQQGDPVAIMAINMLQEQPAPEQVPPEQVPQGQPGMMKPLGA
jgi:hypothetical protein